MATWEYLVEQHDIAEKWSGKKQAEELANFKDRLDSLGSAGWELVNYVSVPLKGAITGSAKGHIYLAFFKRPTG